MIGKEIADNNDKNKYKIKEIENFNDIKRKMDIKISDFYAYFNRKEYEKEIKNKVISKAYEFYLKDINKINQKNEKKIKIEKKSIKKIKFLLEDINKGKQLLKNKINEYNVKYQYLKDINNIVVNNLENDEQNSSESIKTIDIFDPPTNRPEKKKKIILPKLLLKKNSII